MPLAIHQQAADELGGNLLGGEGEEALVAVLGGSWMGVVAMGLASVRKY